MADTVSWLSLEIALRALNAVCLHYQSPESADEAHLREITDDTHMPIDELASQVIQSELQRLRRAQVIKSKVQHA